MVNVFLLGDSICQGYAGYVSEALYGIAEVHCPADNARFTTYQLKYLNDWLEPVRKCGDVDVFHFNSGLWDVLRIDGDMPLVGRESYAGNIRRLIHRVRQHCPKAQLILATTTKVLDEREREDFCRLNKDVEEYNALAADFAAQEGIEVDDLYEVTASSEFMEHREDGIHFTECGYRKLADKVFDAVAGKLMENEACRRKVMANFGYYQAQNVDLAHYGRIVVYGYGRFGAYILHQLDVCPPRGQVCVIDRDSQKHGFTPEGVPVISLEEYQCQRKSDDVAIVSLTDRQESAVVKKLFCAWDVPVFGIYDFQYWRLESMGLLQ